MKRPGTGILGVSAYHGDSSASSLTGGRVAAAVEEERFTRVKHWAGFPTEAVRYCLAAAGDADRRRLRLGRGWTRWSRAQRVVERKGGG